MQEAYLSSAKDQNFLGLSLLRLFASSQQPFGRLRSERRAVAEHFHLLLLRVILQAVQPFGKRF